MQNLLGEEWEIDNLIELEKKIPSITFLLAKNSIPRAICNDHEIKSLVLMIRLDFSSDCIPLLFNSWNCEISLATGIALDG